jgi:6-pyruvoyltetrahydropterin/6-carboxytetrahydropterin synthase
MPTVRVTRRVTFNAAHRLHNPARSDEWNRETYGKCNSPNGHGHNYVLEVTVEGSPDPDTGYVIDLGILKNIINERVIEVVDHANLNLDVEFMAGVLPSTENFAVAIWNQIEPHVEGGRLLSVRLRETENNSVEYFGDR